MVGMAGFEPAASASRTLRANQTAPHPEGPSFYVGAFRGHRSCGLPIGVIADEALHRAAERARLDRLHELRVGRGAPGEETVCLAVEEQEDRNVREPPGRFFEVQIDRDRDPTHVADL